MGGTAPNGYLSCDGSTYSITTYSDLANFIYNNFGSTNYFGGNGTTTFAVPDLRGEFLRGTGTNGHANEGSGANVGVHQGATFVGHVYVADNGAMYWYISEMNNYICRNPDFNLAGNRTRVAQLSHSANAASNQPLRISVRPTNTSVLYVIKAKYVI